MRRFDFSLIWLVLIPILTGAHSRSSPVIVGGDRHIRFEQDRQDEEGGFVFYRDSDGRQLFRVTSVHGVSRPVIKYSGRDTELLLYTNFGTVFSNSLNRSAAGHIHYLMFRIDRRWRYTVQRCVIAVSEASDPGIFRARGVDGGFDERWIGRFVVAELEKSRSAWAARSRCKTEAPRMGHEGLYEG